jgi:hypothetical protein
VPGVPGPPNTPNAPLAAFELVEPLSASGPVMGSRPSSPGQVELVRLRPGTVADGRSSLQSSPHGSFLVKVLKVAGQTSAAVIDDCVEVDT